MTVPGVKKEEFLVYLPENIVYFNLFKLIAYFLIRGECNNMLQFISGGYVF